MADVPLDVVTVTPTEAGFTTGGLEAVIVEALTTVTFVAIVVPNSTAAPAAKPFPVIVTNVPPSSGPVDGLMPETVGAYVNKSSFDVADVPPGVVTVRSTVPVPAGLRAISDKPLLATLKVVAGLFVPKSTAVTFVKPVPIIVTIVPLAVGPDVGLNPVTMTFDGLIRSSSTTRSGRKRRRKRDRSIRWRSLVTRLRI